MNIKALIALFVLVAVPLTAWQTANAIRIESAKVAESILADSAAVTAYADSSAKAAWADSIDATINGDSLHINTTATKISADRFYLSTVVCGVDSISQDATDKRTVSCTAVGDSSNTAIFVTPFQGDFGNVGYSDVVMWVETMTAGTSFTVHALDVAGPGDMPIWFFWMVVRRE